MNYNKILKKWIDRKIIEMCWFELQDRDVKSVVQMNNSSNGGSSNRYPTQWETKNSRTKRRHLNSSYDFK